MPTADPGSPGPLSDAGRMRRRATRWEDAVAVLLGLLAAAGLAVAWATAGSAHESVRDRAVTESAERTRIEATVSATAGPLRDLDSGVQQVTVSWVGPDGTPRTGDTTVAGLAEAGDRVPVWTDPAGTLTDPPTGPEDAALVAGAVAVAVVLAWAAGVLLLGRLCYRLTAARIARSWALAWADVEPDWSGRRRIG